jgi:hypothetical protein
MKRNSPRCAFESRAARPRCRIKLSSYSDIVAAIRLRSRYLKRVTGGAGPRPEQFQAQDGTGSASHGIAIIYGSPRRDRIGGVQLTMSDRSDFLVSHSARRQNGLLAHSATVCISCVGPPSAYREGAQICSPAARNFPHKCHFGLARGALPASASTP